MTTSARMTPGMLAADPALKRLWSRVRARLERSGGRLGGSVSLALPTEDERRAVELLLGQRRRGGRLRVRLEELDRALRESRLAAGLITVLEADRPLRDVAAERAARGAAEERLWAGAKGHRAIVRHPTLEGWLVRLRQSGRLSRIAPGQPFDVLGACLDVLTDLPASGVDRAVLASEHFGDAHALDDDRPLTRLLLSALAHLEQTPLHETAENRRRLFETYGVLSDATSSTALVLNLRPRPVGPITQATSLYADAAVPAPVTLQMLHAESWQWTTPSVVWVCENQTILGVAARRLRGRCPPMVCVQGMLSVAARRLLTSMTESGIELRYHGDFDKGGLWIANIVIGELGARPWRMTAADYRAAVAITRRSISLKGALPLARWDPGLSEEMASHRVAVQEEQLADLLVGDLEGAAVRNSTD